MKRPRAPAHCPGAPRSRACSFPRLACSAEAGIVFFGSTGLSMDGLKGWLGEKDPEDRIVVRTDESPTHLLFIWDSPDLQPRLSISDAKGAARGGPRPDERQQGHAECEGRVHLRHLAKIGQRPLVLRGARREGVGRPIASGSIMQTIVLDRIPFSVDRAEMRRVSRPARRGPGRRSRIRRHRGDRRRRGESRAAQGRLQGQLHSTQGPAMKP